MHDYVHVDHPIIYQLINSKEFQRLRHIKQLGTSGFTFHGGEHSRFLCLGAYEISRRILSIFEESMQSNGILMKNLPTMTAALLHDIGHGAHSHTFEGLFGTDHEKMTQRDHHQSRDGGQSDPLTGSTLDFPNRVASVIDHTYPNKQVVQLISSQIDVDRMDLFTAGCLLYGCFPMENLTLTRILRVIRPIENGIAFQQNGMHAVEGLRGQPLPNVYGGLLPPGYSCHGSPPSKSTPTR